MSDNKEETKDKRRNPRDEFHNPEGEGEYMIKMLTGADLFRTKSSERRKGKRENGR